MSTLALEKCSCAFLVLPFLLVLLPFICARTSAHILSHFKENEENIHPILFFTPLLQREELVFLPTMFLTHVFLLSE